MAAEQRHTGLLPALEGDPGRLEFRLLLQTVEHELVEAAGGKVMALSLEPGYSTTNIEKEILARP